MVYNFSMNPSIISKVTSIQLYTSNALHLDTMELNFMVHKIFLEGYSGPLFLFDMLTSPIKPQRKEWRMLSKKMPVLSNERWLCLSKNRYVLCITLTGWHKCDFCQCTYRVLRVSVSTSSQAEDIHKVRPMGGKR